MLRKLRVLVLVGAALLMTVVAGFVWYGRMVARRFKLDLPKRLGVNITQESHVVTLSRSIKGKTVFTLHAADQVQQQNGTIELHDVGIELFGRQDGRSDKISGQDFIFDQKKGIMTGVGEVLIDLAAPESKTGKPAAGVGAGNNTAAKTVHVKTSGLVFNQEAQTAMTDQRIEFMAGGMSGNAVGASYDAKSGVVDLKSAVHVSGLQADRPVVLTASWAELQRTQNLVLLTSAKYTAVGEQGGESVAADQAQVHLSQEGAPREIEGQGHVELSGPDRGTMTGERMELYLTDASKPQTWRVWGGVRYGYDEGVKKASGTAREVRVGFNAAGEAEQAIADGGVLFNEQVADGTRRLTAARVKFGFAAGAVRGHVSLRDADAMGGAMLRSTGDSAKGRTVTEVSGDELKARFAAVGGKDQITTLDGAGHTVVHQVAANGVDETSKGEMLAVSFRPGGAAKGKDGSTAQIERAVQHGGVTVVRTTPPVVRLGTAKGAPAKPEVEKASGDEAVYLADGETLTVTGEAQLDDATSVLLADKVEMARLSGDATAEGNVRVSYLQEDGKGEPLHITAARAVEKKAAGTADFFGTTGKDARMWQEGSQVQAPVLSFSQSGKDKGSRKLVAHGEMAGNADFVKAVLVSAGEPEQKTAQSKGKRGESAGGPVRIEGHVMTYTEAARTVEFAGRVKVQDQDGMMTAERAVAYLADKTASADTATAAQGAAAGLMGGRVERVVANGTVVIEQPGRTGTGEQLVYTASDRTFVLTGTAAAPPKVVDEAQGTSTGAVLRFRSGDDSVLISSTPGDSAVQAKVHSETRVRLKQ